MRDCQGSANEKHYTSSSHFPPMDFLFTTALLPPFLYERASSALFSHCAFCRVNSVVCPAEPHRQMKRSVCASRASLQPSDRVLLSKLYGPQGTFYFTSHSPGEHIICLESNSTRLVSFGGSKLRIHLEIRVGQHDLDAAAAQAKDKVNEVSFKLERLIEQIEQIVKEQNYQRDREENFRMTSEDTNSNVLWWAFAQTLIFIAIGIFQMKHLKDFFIAKKLV
uniref:GOLD domain-containing protein n=1 Tax=Felis catus TaxID=9685 RepID=A0ABI7VUD6_FELCA